jgi:hypothetical protein
MNKERQRPFCSDCADAIRTRFDISLPDSCHSPMAGRGQTRSLMALESTLVYRQIDGDVYQSLPVA